MPTTTTNVDPTDAVAALEREVDRVCTLLRSGPDPGAPALGQWSLADVGVHLTHAFAAIDGLLRQDLSEVRSLFPSIPTRDSGSLIGDVWQLGEVTTEAVLADRTHDLGAIADRLEERAADFLKAVAVDDLTRSRPWLVDGVELPGSVLCCHLLNETVVHGYDMAVAAGRPWRTDRRSAALVLDGFLMPIARGLPPTALLDPDRAAGVRATYELRIRGGGRHHLVFGDSGLELPENPPARIDCHLSVDPAAFLLVAWGRIGQWGPISRGQLLAWGRRPHLALVLRTLLRNP